MTSLNQWYMRSKIHLELGCMKMELGHIHPTSKMIIVLVFYGNKQV
jgi:hypothetical protein